MMYPMCQESSHSIEGLPWGGFCMPVCIFSGVTH
jgi:hypothetical protein